MAIRFLICLVALCGAAGGCVTVRAPEEIHIGSGPRPAKVDSSQVPATTSHEQARAELINAYQQIRYLEHQNKRCRAKLEDAKERGDDYKRKYKRLEKKYDD